MYYKEGKKGNKRRSIVHGHVYKPRTVLLSYFGGHVYEEQQLEQVVLAKIMSCSTCIKKNVGLGCTIFQLVEELKREKYTV